ncbi:hypothetical protein N7474_007506 [Penicillium riverlandense]|uniref:uncharacterized protein n=1 Tax=Penicillium riverlandense TaxID=1903569 RepID=UPI0025499717|nr:uncharacterized protein N7474_007506 [Penicillium riverlandense]KAJ5815729.1 hypothetical protein N7474_007506 [Penicillium riverlandense]
MLNPSISLLLLALGTGSALAGMHDHRAHAHQKRRANMMVLPAVTVVEARTVTTTIFENCAATRPILTATTLGEDLPLATAHHLETEETTTVRMTTTVTRTATDFVTVTAERTHTTESMPEDRILDKPNAVLNLVKQIQPALPKLPKLPNLPQLLPDIPVNQISKPKSPKRLDWTSIPAHGAFSTKGFGGRTAPQDTNIQYRGNIGRPWGSNIIGVSPAEAHLYKYVVQFSGPETEPWTVTVWNKVGPTGKMDGWYGHAALTFVLHPHEVRYVAFDEDSEGGWAAGPGEDGLPTDAWGGYTTTWGEFSFGDVENGGWSGWDVSAIQAQLAGQHVQGMRICMADGKGCSIVGRNANKVINAYTDSKRHRNGIGGATGPGPVRLVANIDYQG